MKASIYLMVFNGNIRMLNINGCGYMNIKNLVTFKTILETGSFQKAADKLNYTQSTVTFQIQQLENELSFKLFEKIGRKMEPTQVGKDILPYVETIIESAEQIHNYGKSLSEITGSLRLVIPDHILIYNMQEWIQCFVNTAPNIQLIINSLPSEEINQAIINGIADIGIDCDKGNFPDTIIHKNLTPTRACLVAAPSIDEELRDFITPHQHKPISMIYNEPNSNYQRAMTEYLEKKDIVLGISMKMVSVEAIKKSVMNNIGIAYIPIFAIREELKNGSLIQIETGIDDRMYDSVCVYHKNKWLSPQMELALHLLDERKEKAYL